MAEPGTASPEAQRLRVAVPDLISPSYFPMIAAAQMGLCDPDVVSLDLELRFPVTEAAKALSRGEIDVLAGAAHAALYAFPGWRGVKLLAALSRYTYWLLVVRSDLSVTRNDIDALRGLRIAAAPGPDLALRVLLEDADIPSGEDDDAVRIVPVIADGSETISFGVAAAEALEAGQIDGFWANGMGAEVAVRRGTGTVLLDVRRGDGPTQARSYTFPAAMATVRTISERPEAVSALIGAVARAHELLRERPEYAAEVVDGLFPPMEATLIVDLIRRDLPFYDTEISEAAVAGVNAMATRAGLLEGAVETDVVLPPAPRGL